MEHATLSSLMLLAAAIGVVHTVTGPDHYLPFIAMSRVGGWSRLKTVMVTLVCGVGHVLGSIAIGAAGIGLGWAITSLESLESLRGDIAGWLLLGFGLAYTVWAVRQLMRTRRHTHLHAHADGTLHAHEHDHQGGHIHVHSDSDKSMTPWVLFAIFVFGPCEPLIPILMFPAALHSIAGVAAVCAVFAITTLATMGVMVMLGVWGMSHVRLDPLARYAHVIAGLTILACGLAIQLGL